MRSDLSRARLHKINDLFSAVVSLPPDQRIAAITDRCGSDYELAAAVRLRVRNIETEESLCDLGADFSKSYALSALIGKGGMGEVYRATQIRLDRDVAVKKIRNSVGHTPRKIVAAFLKEAALAGKLQHPGIVPVHDVGTIDGRPCYAMELVEGVSLDEAILDPDTTFDIATAVSTVAKLAEALDEAHKHGIIHRDVKPSNILLDSRGQPKITDFGVARLIDEDSQTPSASIAGSIGFVAPEQVAGSTVNQTADIFSLGAILFTLLTGKPPFVDSSTTSIHAFAEAALNSPAPVIQSDSGRVGRTLVAACLRCLHRDPRKRYQSAADLANDLNRFLRWHRRKTTVYVAGSIIALLALGGAFFAQKSIRQDIAATEQQADADFVTGISTAFRSWEEGDVKQARKVLSQLSPPSGETDRRGIEWDYLSFETHKEKAIFGTHDLSDGGLSLHPGGALLASGSDDGAIQLWDRKTYGKVGELKGHTKVLSRMVFSPSGDTLVSAATAQLPPSKSHEVDVGADSEFVVWDVNSREEVALVTIPKQEIKSIVFAPSEPCFYVLTDTIKKYDYLGKCLDTIALSGTSLAAHPDGNSIVVGTSEGELAIADTGTHEIRHRLSAHSSAVSKVSFSSDGRTILSAGLDGIINRWNSETGQSEQMVFHDSAIVDFCFDERNNQIIYTPGNTIFITRIGDVVGDNPIRLFGHEVPIRGFPVFQLAFDQSTNELVSWGAKRCVSRLGLVSDVEPSDEADFDGARTGVSCIGTTRSGMIVTAGEYGSIGTTLHIYQVGNDSPQIVPVNAGGHVRELAIHPNGESSVLLCENSVGQQVFLLNNEFAISHAFSGGLDVDRVAFNHSGDHIATAGHNHTTLWKDDGGFLCRIPTHTGAAGDIAFSADDRLIAVASSSSELKIWKISDQTVAFKIQAPRDNSIGIASVEFSPDGEFIATSSAAGMRLWNASDGTAVRNLTGPFEEQKRITDIAFLSDDKLVCVSGNGISFFHTESGELVREWHHEHGVPSKIESIGNELFVSFQGLDAGEISVWDATEAQPKRSISYESRFAAGKLNAMAFLPGHSKLLVAGGSDEGLLTVLNPNDCSITHTYPIHERVITSLDVSRDGNWIVTGSADRSVKVLSSNDFSPTLTLRGHDEIVTSVAFNPDATLIASAGGHDGTVCLWDRKSGDLLHQHESNAYVLDVQFGLGGTVVIAAQLAYDDAWIDVFDTSSARKLNTVQCPHLFEIVAHPTAASAAYCTGDQVVLWDIATGVETTRFTAAAPSAAFTSDATRLLFPEHQQVVFRHIHARKEMIRISAGTWPGQNPRHVAIDSDRRFFAVASRDGIVECWRTK